MNAVTRIDRDMEELNRDLNRDTEDLAWAENRFNDMTVEVTTLWDIAQDIEANWTEGRNVSRFYGGLAASQVLRNHVIERKSISANAGVDGSSLRLMRYRLNGARAKRLAPPQYQGYPPGIYQSFPPEAPKEDIARIFKRAEKLEGGITQRNMLVAMGMGYHMKPPYWQQVITAATSGEHLLTPAIARNLIATLQYWLQTNPDAPTRE